MPFLLHSFELVETDAIEVAPAQSLVAIAGAEKVNFRIVLESIASPSEQRTRSMVAIVRAL